jgi:ribonuclease HI
LCWVISTTKIN